MNEDDAKSCDYFPFFSSNKILFFIFMVHFENVNRRRCGISHILCIQLDMCGFSLHRCTHNVTQYPKEINFSENLISFCFRVNVPSCSLKSGRRKRNELFDIFFGMFFETGILITPSTNPTKAYCSKLWCYSLDLICCLKLRTYEQVWMYHNDQCIMQRQLCWGIRLEFGRSKSGRFV